MLGAVEEGELWGRHAHGWAERVEPRMRPLYEVVLARLGPPEGLRLLDVGCATGLLASMAAERGAEVTGVDAAVGSVEHATGRVPSQTFAIADACELPFEAHEFSAASALDVLGHTLDPYRALTELARVCRPGSPVLVAIDHCAAARDRLLEPLAPPPSPGPARPRVEDQATLAAVLDQAGLRVVEQFGVSDVWELADAGRAVEEQLLYGSVEAAVRHSGRAEVSAALERGLEAHRQADGSVAVPVAFGCTLALTPG